MNTGTLGEIISKSRKDKIMNLQSLFNEQIQTVTKLGGHASDVWHVRTSQEDVVVRSSGVSEDSDAPFIFGCNKLFGVELNKTFDLEIINKELSLVSPIPIPKCIRKGVIDGREFVVVTMMVGEKVDLKNVPSSIAYQFGRDLAEIHSNKFTKCGNIKGTLRYSLDEFHLRLFGIIEKIISRFYSDNKVIADFWETYKDEVTSLPSPDFAAFIMVDMDSRQILSDGTRVTSIVDTEAYVIGPKEFDLIALEYNFNQETATSFKLGYQSVTPFPNLSLIRNTYRFFYGLMQVKGPIEINDWMTRPILF
ncbi:hypothetical protein [Paenibacillus glacialis]|uniref:Aminoglycoside phosphotransferase domain-containing protein n=1 Tax=Paenibacillus glacialis TaxID=494026 RepID=A0A168HLJ2_9BACL|nr:hypothetical protein [Paenibacillus glacialis]OAB38309.1 hypothetical protein PGLA_19600 [Paenibacillus glacialis]